MEIFNIHLFEFLLIAGLALIIFGPERLPEVGRFIGKQVARFLAWQQQSPELQVINDVRAELDREIASLRDELMRTRTQLDVSQDMETLRKDLRSMVRLRDEPGAAVPEAANTIARPRRLIRPRRPRRSMALLLRGRSWRLKRPRRPMASRCPMKLVASLRLWRRRFMICPHHPDPAAPCLWPGPGLKPCASLRRC